MSESQIIIRPVRLKLLQRSCKEMAWELLVNQVRYSMFSRDAENGALDSMKRLGIGGVAFAPLHSGMLTDKYIHGLPADSRAMRDPRYLKPCDITSEKLDKIRQLNELAKKREQSLAQMALAWVLRVKPSVPH